MGASAHCPPSAWDAKATRSRTPSRRHPSRSRHESRRPRAAPSSAYPCAAAPAAASRIRLRRLVQQFPRRRPAPRHPSAKRSRLARASAGFSIVAIYFALVSLLSLSLSLLLSPAPRPLAPPPCRGCPSAGSRAPLAARPRPPLLPGIRSSRPRRRARLDCNTVRDRAGRPLSSRVSASIHRRDATRRETRHDTTRLHTTHKGTQCSPATRPLTPRCGARSECRRATPRSARAGPPATRSRRSRSRRSAAPPIASSPRRRAR